MSNTRDNISNPTVDHDVLTNTGSGSHLQGEHLNEHQILGPVKYFKALRADYDVLTK